MQVHHFFVNQNYVWTNWATCKTIFYCGYMLKYNFLALRLWQGFKNEVWGFSFGYFWNAHLSLQDALARLVIGRPGPAYPACGVGPEFTAVWKSTKSFPQPWPVSKCKQIKLSIVDWIVVECWSRCFLQWQKHGNTPRQVLGEIWSRCWFIVGYKVL